MKQSATSLYKSLLLIVFLLFFIFETGGFSATHFIDKLFLLFNLCFTVYLKECQNHSVFGLKIIQNLHLLFETVTRNFVVTFEMETFICVKILLKRFLEGMIGH